MSPPDVHATLAVAEAASRTDQECSPLVATANEAVKNREAAAAVVRSKKQTLTGRLFEYCRGSKCPSGTTHRDVEAAIEALAVNGDENAFRQKLEEHKKFACAFPTDASCAYSQDVERLRSDIEYIAHSKEVSSDAERRVRDSAFAADQCVKKHAAEIAASFEYTAIPRSSWYTTGTPDVQTLGDAAEQASVHAGLTGVRPLRWCRYKDGFAAFSSVVEDTRPRTPAASPEVAQVAFAVGAIRTALDPSARRWHGVAYVTAADVEYAGSDDESLAWRVLHENDCAPALPSDLQKKHITTNQRTFEFLYVFERPDPYKGPGLVTVTEDEAHAILGY